MSLYQVLDLAINSLTLGSVLFFGTLFLLHSLNHTTTAVEELNAQEETLPVTETELAETEEPTLEELFYQADEIIISSVNPPITDTEADLHLDAPIAALVATETAITSACHSLVKHTPAKSQRSASKNAHTAHRSVVKLPPTTSTTEVDLHALSTLELITLAKSAHFPGSKKWSLNRAIGQDTKAKVFQFLQERQ